MFFLLAFIVVSFLILVSAGLCLAFVPRAQIPWILVYFGALEVAAAVFCFAMRP